MTEQKMIKVKADKRISIDPVVIMHGDNETREIEIELPLQCEGIDVLNASAYLIINNSIGVDIVVLSTYVSDDKLIAVWTVQDKQAVTGEVGLQVKIQSGARVWLSKTAVIKVYKSLDAGQTITELYPSILEQHEERIETLETAQAAAVTKEYIDDENAKQDIITDELKNYSDALSVTLNSEERERINSDLLLRDAINLKAETVLLQEEILNRVEADMALSRAIDTRVGMPTYNPQTYEIIFTAYDGATVVIDLPIEKLGLSYDAATKEMIFVNSAGDEQRISLSAFVDIYTGSIGDHIQVSVSAENVVKATLLNSSIDMRKLSTTLQNLINGKADATALLSETSTRIQDDKALQAEVDTKAKITDAVLSTTVRKIQTVTVYPAVEEPGVLYIKV